MGVTNARNKIDGIESVGQPFTIMIQSTLVHVLNNDRQTEFTHV